MKKVLIVLFGSLFLASCGPKRMGCGPYRRCEVKAPTSVSSEINKSQVS